MFYHIIHGIAYQKKASMLPCNAHPFKSFNFVRETFESISKAAEAVLFLYLGLTAYYYADEPWSLNFVLLGLLILGLSRLGGCVSLYALVKYSLFNNSIISLVSVARKSLLLITIMYELFGLQD